MPGIIDEHSYTIVPGEGRHLLGSDSDGGQGGLEIDLPRETCSPRGEGSGSGVTSPRLSQGSDSPTGSESPACSLPDNDNIPDAKKYKNRMLARYLNDAEEAQWHNNRKNSQGTTAGDFSSEDGDVVYPDQSNLSAGVQENGVGASVQEAASTTQRDGYDSPPTLLPQTEQWQPVDGNLIPTPSNNITISFTHLPLEKDLVPVLTQPPRDNMGVDKVKRQLDLRSDGEGPTVFNSAPNQTVYVSLPTVPLSLPSEQFSTTGGPPYSIKSEGGRSNSSSPISSVSSPNKVFPSQSLRPPFIGSILPGPFPFYPGGPLNGWHFPVGPVPFPHFLHLAPPPDPSKYSSSSSYRGEYLRLLVRPLSKCRIASTNRRTSQGRVPQQFRIINMQEASQPFPPRLKLHLDLHTGASAWPPWHRNTSSSTSLISSWGACPKILRAGLLTSWSYHFSDICNQMSSDLTQSNLTQDNLKGSKPILEVHLVWPCTTSSLTDAP